MESKNFNPLRLCRRRPGELGGIQGNVPISIRSARSGGDLSAYRPWDLHRISTRSARAGGDVRYHAAPPPFHSNFNPLRQGVRRLERLHVVKAAVVISTLSARVGGDVQYKAFTIELKISTLSARVGGDP